MRIHEVAWWLADQKYRGLVSCTKIRNKMAPFQMFLSQAENHV